MFKRTGQRNALKAVYTALAAGVMAGSSVGTYLSITAATNNKKAAWSPEFYPSPAIRQTFSAAAFDRVRANLSPRIHVYIVSREEVGGVDDGVVRRLDDSLRHAGFKSPQYPAFSYFLQDTQNLRSVLQTLGTSSGGAAFPPSLLGNNTCLLVMTDKDASFGDMLTHSREKKSIYAALRPHYRRIFRQSGKEWLATHELTHCGQSYYQISHARKEQQADAAFAAINPTQGAFVGHMRALEMLRPYMVYESHIGQVPASLPAPPLHSGHAMMEDQEFDAATRQVRLYLKQKQPLSPWRLEFAVSYHQPLCEALEQRVFDHKIADPRERQIAYAITTAAKLAIEELFEAAPRRCPARTAAKPFSPA